MTEIKMDDQAINVILNEDSKVDPTTIRTEPGKLFNKFSSKTIKIASVIAVVLLILLIRSLFNGSDGLVTDSVVLIEENTIALNDNKHSFDDNIISYQSSIDNKAVVVLTDYEDSGGTLWYLKANEKTKIADDVNSFQISIDGTGVVYLNDLSHEDNEGSLYVFNGSKSEKVADNVYQKFFAISPDGNSTLYVRDFDMDEQEFSTYMRIGNKAAEKLGDNFIPLAISNKGKYVYYAKTDPSEDSADLELRKGKNTIRLRSNVEEEPRFIFNKDLTQVIFSEDGRSYISVKGAEPTRIANYEIDSVLTSNFIPVKHSSELLSISFYDIDNLYEMSFINNEGELVYHDKKHESSLIERNADSPVITEDNQSIFYINSRDRITRKNVRNLDGEANSIAEDVSQFVVSPDSKKLYYIDYNDDLYYIKGSSDAKRISSDATDLYMSGDGEYIYFLTDFRRGTGSLYYSKNGKERKKISDDVTEVSTTASGIFYSKESESDKNLIDLYYSQNNTKFEVLGKDIESFLY
jgi:hypothetical protein